MRKEAQERIRASQDKESRRPQTGSKQRQRDQELLENIRRDRNKPTRVQNRARDKLYLRHGLYAQAVWEDGLHYLFKPQDTFYFSMLVYSSGGTKLKEIACSPRRYEQLHNLARKYPIRSLTATWETHTRDYTVSCPSGAKNQGHDKEPMAFRLVHDLPSGIQLETLANCLLDAQTIHGITKEDLERHRKERSMREQYLRFKDGFQRQQRIPVYCTIKAPDDFPRTVEPLHYSAISSNGREVCAGTGNAEEVHALLRGMQQHCDIRVSLEPTHWQLEALVHKYATVLPSSRSQI